MTKFFLLISISFFIFSCIGHNNPNELTSKHGFPDTATNLSIVNSEYDDYNSAQQGDGESGTFVFSSNRNSKGKDFDIVQYNTFYWYTEFYDDELTVVGVDTAYHYTTSTIKNMLKTINTKQNEFGPYIYAINNSSECLLFYAQENSGKLDLKFMVNRVDSVSSTQSNMHYMGIHGPYDVHLLNTANSSEAYISIDNNFIYYCSDEKGDFDVYQYPMNLLLPGADECTDFLIQKPSQKPIAITSINSTADDKCPYVVGNYMVFSSDRKGGLGGYDLWYSEFINNKWTEPKNFGPAINSKYDEYRPIIKSENHTFNNLMIFSSNRPGGKGGFDLYYVGINRRDRSGSGVIIDTTQQ